MTKAIHYKEPMEAWPELASYSQTINLTSLDLQIFYFEAGDPKKTKLILIHGLGDEADTWRHVIQPLAEEYHVLALDLPGFGRSEKPIRQFTPQFLIKTIMTFMDSLSIPSGWFMGSSLGGILSHAAALQNPDRVSGLILVDGAFLQARPMSDRGLQLMRIPLLGEFLYTKLRWDPEAAFNSLRVVYHDLDSLPAADKSFLFKRVNRRVWSRGQRRAYFSTLRNLVPWVNKNQSGLREKLASLQIPTLVLRGEYDALFPRENSQAIVETQPRAESITIKGVNHLPQQEAPEEFLQIVQDWLERQIPKKEYE